MTPSRLTRARNMAGLSIAQATRLLSCASSWIPQLERGLTAPDDADLAALAELYGVTVAWLRGAEVELPAATREALRQVEHDGDRAQLTALEAAQGAPKR